MRGDGRIPVLEMGRHRQNTTRLTAATGHDVIVDFLPVAADRKQVPHLNDAGVGLDIAATDASVGSIPGSCIKGSGMGTCTLYRRPDLKITRVLATHQNCVAATGIAIVSCARRLELGADCDGKKR